MMLDTDMCMYYSYNQRYTECMVNSHHDRQLCKPLKVRGDNLLAREHNCCAWTGMKVLTKRGIVGANSEDQGFCGDVGREGPNTIAIEGEE